MQEQRDIRKIGEREKQRDSVYEKIMRECVSMSVRIFERRKKNIRNQRGARRKTKEKIYDDDDRT